MNSRAPRIDRIDANLLINGNFDFWQRGSAFTASGGYTADRWKTQLAGASITRIDLSGILPKARYGIRYTATAQEILLEQRVESNFARMFEGEEITIAITSRAIVGTTALLLDVFTPNAVDNWASSTSVISNQNIGTLDSTLTKYTFKMTVTSTMASNGFNVIFKCGVVTATVEFAQAMASLGDENAEFNIAGTDHVNEQNLCERYYEKSYQIDEAPGTNNGLAGAAGFHSRATNQHTGTVNFKVRKRAVPTMTPYDQAGTAGRMHDQGIGDINSFAQMNSQVGSSGFSMVNSNGGFAVGGDVLFHWTADAEL